MDATAQHHLRQLADSYGVEHGYHDDLKRWHDAEPESILAVLRLLGASLHGVGDVESALRERKQSLWRRPLEPVLVAWDGHTPGALFRQPAKDATTRLECRIDYESGQSQTWTCTANMFHAAEGADVEGGAYEARRLTLPTPLPLGWHKLTVAWKGDKAECTLLSAPTRAYGPDKMMHTWGVFLPLYALRTARDWGTGDFTDLGNLIDWVQNQGGGIVGTLPLLAAYLDKPLEPSPYSPASRLFWNELYIDPRQAAEFTAAQGVVNSRSFAVERDALPAVPLVDYKRTAALKRRVLEEMSRTFFAKPGHTSPSMERFIDSHPRVKDYARFRAVVEKRGASWWTWPEPARRRHPRRRLRRNGPALSSVRAVVGRRPGVCLGGTGRQARPRPLSRPAARRQPRRLRCLERPRGVRRRRVGGAAPDSFFTLGQDWGFPPLHPENLRATGYRYLRDVLKHHFQYAGVLRIDHLMGLHHFYWVPRELGATKGVYVRTPSDEWYATFCLESNRNKCALVGEDLGTVPPDVRPAMARHNVHRLYLGQFEMKPDRNDPFTWVPGGSVASLNTHDLPTFAAFWKDEDIADRQSQGLIDEETAHREREYRRHLREAVLEKLRQEGRIGWDAAVQWILRACLTHMAQYGEPLFVLSNLEDLWLSPEPQNRPGTTWTQQPNWQTKATHSLEELDELPGLRDTLRALDEAVRSRR